MCAPSNPQDQGDLSTCMHILVFIKCSFTRLYLKLIAGEGQDSNNDEPLCRFGVSVVKNSKRIKNTCSILLYMYLPF